MFGFLSPHNAQNEKSNGNGNGNGHGHLIDVRDVVKEFNTAAGTFTALKGVDLQANAGEFVAVIGRSGSGKSTMINMITGIDRPTSGEVYVAGTPVHTLSEGQMAVWRGRNLGVVFQFFQLLPMLTLLENVMLPMDFCNMFPGRERQKRALELLDMMSMADQADKLPSAVSGGQQQRVAIARALANDPPIIVADEPTGNLDSKTADSVFSLFASLVEQGKTIIMVTHDSGLARRVSRTVLIADGEIVNEFVTRALPTLNYQQMLTATHHLEPVRYAPGQVILKQGEASDRFYIITEGTVEVALSRPGGSEVVANRMGVGQYFGEIEMVRGGKTIATIRAGESPVEVVALEREVFIGLLAESEATRSMIEGIAKERIDENAAARRN